MGFISLQHSWRWPVEDLSVLYRRVCPSPPLYFLQNCKKWNTAKSLGGKKVQSKDSRPFLLLFAVNKRKIIKGRFVRTWFLKCVFSPVTKLCFLKSHAVPPLCCNYKQDDFWRFTFCLNLVVNTHFTLML